MKPDVPPVDCADAPPVPPDVALEPFAATPVAEQVARLRELSVYLNWRLAPPPIPET